MKQRSRALIVKDTKVLLMFRNKYGDAYFSIPGGKREGDESVEQTAQREVEEETTIKCKVTKLLARKLSPEENTEHTLFLAEYVSGEASLPESSVEGVAMAADADNIYLPSWVNIEKAVELEIRPEALSAPFKEYIKKLL